MGYANKMCKQAMKENSIELSKLLIFIFFNIYLFYVSVVFDWIKILVSLFEFYLNSGVSFAIISSEIMRKKLQQIYESIKNWLIFANR